MQGKKATFRLDKKGGVFNEVPVHHLAEAYLDEYLAAARLLSTPKNTPLFRRLDRSRQIQRLPSLDTLTKKKRDELIESVRLDPRNEGGDTLYDETPVTDRGCDLISSSDNSCQKWRRRESNPRPVISPRKLLRV